MGIPRECVASSSVQAFGHNILRPKLGDSAPFMEKEAAKDSTVRYHTDQSGTSMYSFEAVFTIAYGLLVHFATCLPSRLVAKWVTRSQLAYEVQGSRPRVIFFTFQF